MNKTSTGIDENLAGLLCYVLGWVTGLVFYFIENENENVRFHAMQSIITFASLNILYFLIPGIPVLGFILAPIIWIGSIALWIILMVTAFQGNRLKLPWIGDLAEKYSKKN